MHVKTSYVLCIDNRDYAASLEVLKVYRVLPDADARRHKQLRVVDESGEDYLYPRDRFVPIVVPSVAKKILQTA
jgi:hypothetical protein